MVFGVDIVNAQHGHVGQEVDSSHFDMGDFKSLTRFKVGFECVVAFGFDQGNVVVFHIFAAFVRSEEAFAQLHANQEHGVDEQLFEQTDGVALAVDNTQRYEKEQVSHFANRHTFGAVTDDAEDGKKSEGGTDAHVVGVAKEQGNEHEHADAEQYKREIVVAATAFRIVKEMYYQPNDDAVDEQTGEQMKCGR